MRAWPVVRRVLVLWACLAKSVVLGWRGVSRGCMMRGGKAGKGAIFAASLALSLAARGSTLFVGDTGL